MDSERDRTRRRPGSGSPINQARELEELGRRFGAPRVVVTEIDRHTSKTGRSGFPLSSRRTAEVVIVVPRPGNKILVHTKKFYPQGIWRLPTGGLRRGEPVDAAIRREAREETGNDLLPLRFLFHLLYRWRSDSKQFESFGFLTTEATGPIISADPREQITAFRDVTRDELAEIAEQLETLGGSWRGWGRFRAAPHRLLLSYWADGNRPLSASGDPPAGD